MKVSDIFTASKRAEQARTIEALYAVNVQAGYTPEDARRLAVRDCDRLKGALPREK